MVFYPVPRFDDMIGRGLVRKTCLIKLPYNLTDFITIGSLTTPILFDLKCNISSFCLTSQFLLLHASGSKPPLFLYLKCYGGNTI